MTQVPCFRSIGIKDTQVPSEDNLKGIEEALKAGGNKKYTLLELPDLNHLFQTAKADALIEAALDITEQATS